MRLLGYSHEYLNESDEALLWFIRATEEAPERRESWFALAEAFYRRSIWDKCLAVAERCLSTPPTTDWLTDIRSNGALPYDYAAMSAWWTGKSSAAIEYGKRAVRLEPENPRFAKNLEWYLEMSNSKPDRLDRFVKRVTDARRLT